MAEAGAIPNAPQAPALLKRRSLLPSFLKQLLQCLLVVVLAAGSYYLISRYLVTSVRVVGSSMVPTLHNSDYYLLNRWIYHFREPKRGDVVVLRDISGNCFAVKRIVAVGGDALYMKDGQVYLNGKKLNEPYLAPGTFTFPMGSGRNQLIMCGKDHFFVMGDNRMNSADSRVYGAIPREDILGMVVR
ncbi:MAG TPA: signal peptidase I [Verrucomicrobiae bacterium]|nr:signal peptidase I [Verrucomicrobiae bacterium]